MGKYRGVALCVQWINPGGTLTLQTPTQSFDVQREIDLIDVTSGTDLDHEYIIGNKKGTLSQKFFDDNSTGATGGTGILAQLIEGTYGTLVWSPMGTAVGMPKQSVAAYVKTLKHSIPFDKGVDVDVTYEKNGPMLTDFGAHW